MAGNEDKHKISNGFEIQQDEPGTYELAALERLEKSPQTYNGRNVVTIFGWIFFILAGDKTNHKNSDEFEFWQDSITDIGVSCP